MTTPKTADRPLVEVSFVFVDSLGHAIEGLNVIICSEAIDFTGVTDSEGHALTLSEAKRGQPIEISIKKRDGSFDLKGTVTPKRDINSYTIHSPELHFEATTRLTPKEELENELNVPMIKEGEVLTIARLFGDLAPFIGSVKKITEVGKVTKDFPTKIAIRSDGKAQPVNPKQEIEHRYKVIKTELPRTILFSVLGARMNYPTSAIISENTYKAMAVLFDCEVAAIKAVTSTESSGDPFLDDGLPPILFERHHFYALTDPNLSENKKKGSKRTPHPYARFADICSPKGGGYGKSGIHQYERLVKAGRLNLEAAIMSCSWGAFQVLGEYWEKFGYSSAEALANDCIKSAEGQVKIFCGFLNMPEKKPAINALKSKDWEKFTAAYNGNKWKTTKKITQRKWLSFMKNLKFNIFLAISLVFMATANGTAATLFIFDKPNLVLVQGKKELTGYYEGRSNRSVLFADTSIEYPFVFYIKSDDFSKSTDVRAFQRPVRNWDERPYTGGTAVPDDDRWQVQFDEIPQGCKSRPDGAQFLAHREESSNDGAPSDLNERGASFRIVKSEPVLSIMMVTRGSVAFSMSKNSFFKCDFSLSPGDIVVVLKKMRRFSHVRHLGADGKESRFWIKSSNLINPYPK